MISPADLDRLMHRAWPGLSNFDVDGWIARVAGGVTGRANSVLPTRAPRDLDAALAEVEEIYRRHGLASMFQISPATQPTTLDAILAGCGYERRSSTVVLAAPIERVMSKLAPARVEVALSDEPDDRWLDCWWAVDARGGPEARAIAQQIVLSCPAIYASAHDASGVVGVGRLVLVDDWGGVYCMAVREHARRRGYATAVLRALLGAGAERDIRHAWLQVTETNRDARALYERAGFDIASRYHYRVRVNRSS